MGATLIDRRQFADVLDELCRVMSERDDTIRRLFALRKRISDHRAACEKIARDAISGGHRPTIEWHRASAEAAACMVLEREL